ncbi:MAG: Hsp20/alpha crystallin family protein [Mobilitalea sp.]
MITKKNYQMKCDVREKKDSYILEVDLPGFEKEEIKAYVKDGYLNISASQNKELKKEHGKYLREERYYGACERSFYVGEDIDPDNIKANYTHGVLNLMLPKIDQEKIKERGRISIA